MSAALRALAGSGLRVGAYHTVCPTDLLDIYANGTLIAKGEITHALRFTAPRAGSYIVLVQSYAEDGMGPYTLALAQAHETQRRLAETQRAAAERAVEH